MARINIIGPMCQDFSEFTIHTGSAIIPVTDAPSGRFALDLSRNNNTANAEVRGIGANGQPAYYNLQTVYYRFWIRWITLATNPDSTLANFQDAASAGKCFLHLNSSGQVVFYDNGGTLVRTGTTQIAANKWTCIEAQIGTGAAATWAIRINGNPEISGTNNLGTTANGSIKFGGNTNSVIDSIQIRDIAIDDAGFPGVSVVTVLNAIANGTDTGWMSGSGTGFVPVAEITPDGDTSYVASIVNGDVFTAALLQTTDVNLVGSINAVKACAVVRNAGSTAMSLRIRSGSYTNNLPAVDPGSGGQSANGYSLLAAIFNTDPNTNGPWSANGVNGLQVGMANATASPARLTYISALVDYTPTPPAKPYVTGNVGLSSNPALTFVEGANGVLINGQAVFLALTPAAGTYNLTGNYPAQGNFASTSATQQLQVTTTSLTATTTSIGAISQTGSSSASVPVTVTQQSGSATPSGAVTLNVDGGASAGGQTFTGSLTNGSVNITASGLTVGTHNFTATYAQQGNFGASTSLQALFTITGISTATAITAATQSGTNGASVSVSVTNTSGSGGTPTGSVTLDVDGVSGAGGTQTLTNGTATFTLAGLSVGTHSLLARFPTQTGVLNGFAGSTSQGGAINSVTITAAQIGVNVTIAPTPNPAGSGQAITVNVTVAQQSGTVTPTGTVALTIDGTAFGSPATLNNGAASFAIGTLAVGTHTIAASYTPATGSNFQPGSSSVSEQVTGLSTHTSISAPSVSFFQDALVTVTVSTP